MSKKDIIIELTKKAGKNVSFIGALGQDRISYIEKELNIILPESYKWFLNEYGSGGIHGVDILGGTLIDIITCIRETKYWREFGLPENLVVIENIDEWLYCLNTSEMKNDECPVVQWYVSDKEIGCNSFCNFYDFLIYRYENMLENMEDEF